MTPSHPQHRSHKKVNRQRSVQNYQSHHHQSPYQQGPYYQPPDPQNHPYQSQHSHSWPQDFAPPTQMPQQTVVPPQASPGSRPARASYQPRERHAAAVSHSAKRSPRNVLLAGGGMLAIAALVAGPGPLANTAEEKTSDNVVCQETIQSSSVLSRAELSEFLAIAERSPREEVQSVIEQPFCTLPSVTVREGVTSEREAYPLEFNPSTWFIVLYEEGEYAGFDFSFSRE